MDSPGDMWSVLGPEPPALDWRGVSLRLGRFCLHNVSLRLETGEWLALVGPTGAGKTLLLELAAGFLEPVAGSIFRAGENLAGVPPENRRLGYVPQDDLLFPHLTVVENLTFGAKRRGRSVEEIEAETAAVCSGLLITHLLDRRLRGISGGEAQRIALGRALLTGADTILLDECTSALDEETRARVGDFLKTLQRDEDLTVLQVTHDMYEARQVSDRIVRMEAGRLAGSTLISAHPFRSARGGRS